MNPTRLFILGALAKHGPMYGHQLRRDARLDRAELWSEVRPGSLYGALHRLAAEGLIEPLRTEQDGQLPARTVYGITGEGHRELRALRAEALQEVRLQPDPVDLALAMSRDLDPDLLRGYLADRVRALSARAAQFDHQRDRMWPGQTVADDLVVEHARLRIRAELDWHRLAAEGLIEPLRTEQDGQLPARTVYGITGEGHRELRALRAEALQEVRLQPDPVDLALAMSRDLDPDLLRGYLEDRVRALSARAAQFDHQRDRMWPGQTVADDLVVEHARLRIRAELDWHRLVLDQLGKLATGSDRAAPSDGRAPA